MLRNYNKLNTKIGVLRILRRTLIFPLFTESWGDDVGTGVPGTSFA